MIEFLFVISVVVNVAFLIYARWLINILKIKEEEFVNINNLVAEYVDHLNSVHELETFYGEPTLIKLIEHGKELSSKLSSIDYIIMEEDEPEPQEEKTDDT